MPWNVDPDISDSGFPEATKWFRSKLPVTDADWDALGMKARQRAFSVSGVSQLEVVQDVWSAIDDAVADGTTISEFKASVGEELASAWGGEAPYRLETVFRTNIQSALNAGRYEQQNDPIVQAQRPLLRYSAIMDSRTTECCRLSHGTVLPASDPWWQSHQPPQHFNCRATAISLQDGDAPRTENPTQVAAAPGFGAPPAIEWSPDISKVDPELADAFIRRTA